MPLHFGSSKIHNLSLLINTPYSQKRRDSSRLPIVYHIAVSLSFNYFLCGNIINLKYLIQSYPTLICLKRRINTTQIVLFNNTNATEQ